MKITLLIYEAQNEGNNKKKNKFQVVASCSVSCSSKIFNFLHHLTHRTNNKVTVL